MGGKITRPSGFTWINWLVPFSNNGHAVLACGYTCIAIESPDHIIMLT